MQLPGRDIDGTEKFVEEVSHYYKEVNLMRLAGTSHCSEMAQSRWQPILH